MRLGAPIFEPYSDPDRWMTALRVHGYSATYCPLDADADDEETQAFAGAAAKTNIVVAEVGAWSNPMSRDAVKRKEALDLCKRQLDLADRVGARCCVNIAGSRGDSWHGPHPDDLTQDTFDAIVATVREIIDEVAPTRTCYSLETMPWMFPDSADSYLELIKAIDRKAFAVHLDPVNLINSPRNYFNNAAILRECFEKLGPQIKSCHGKDITLSNQLMVHLDEVRPGLGNVNYGVFLRELSKLTPDTPLMLEHLQTEEEFSDAARYVRSVADREGLAFI